MLIIFHSWPKGKCIKSKYWFWTKFDTLGRKAAEIFVILYVQPLIFLRFYLSFQKISLIFRNMDIR